MYIILSPYCQVRGHVPTFLTAITIGHCNVLRISQKRGANCYHKLFISLFHYVCCFCSLKNHHNSLARLTLCEVISFSFVFTVIFIRFVWWLLFIFLSVWCKTFGSAATLRILNAMYLFKQIKVLLIKEIYKHGCFFV